MAGTYPKPHRPGHQEISLHGHLDDRIEYVITAASREAFRTYFYEQTDGNLRVFSPGNEFILTPQEIVHSGNGGSFCEYMFGIDPPLADLIKPEIRNRLILYGTSYLDDGNLEFSSSTSGSQNYSRIFLDGNAVTNYFFFTNGVARGTLAQQQRGLLKKLGKLLKRSAAVGFQDEHRLLEEIFSLFDNSTSFFLIRLTNKPHRQYQETFRRLYFANKAIPEADYRELCRLAETYNIDEFQQERIRIDAMYHHRDNRRIIDEYKNILISCERHGAISSGENARLNRLKNLWVRNKIPAALFYTLDEMLKSDRLLPREEREYVSSTRRILESFIRRDRYEGRGVRRDDMVRLLFAKQQASQNRDRSFEQLLLEAGKRVDELLRDGADTRLREDFTNILNYFERYDNTSTFITQLAFMVNYRLNQKMLAELLTDKRAFDRLRPDLFNALFFNELRNNSYLTQFGRMKIDTLRSGLDAASRDEITLEALLKRLQYVAQKERLTQAVLTHVKKRVRSAYSRFHTRNEQAALKAEVTEELRRRGYLNGELPQAIFDDAIVAIQKEAMYLNHLLPQILKDNNLAGREEFIKSSGLDRFHVEELEREYMTVNNLDPHKLVELRQSEFT